MNVEVEVEVEDSHITPINQRNHTRRIFRAKRIFRHEFFSCEFFSRIQCEFAAKITKEYSDFPKSALIRKLKILNLSKKRAKLQKAILD